MPDLSNLLCLCVGVFTGAVSFTNVSQGKISSHLSRCTCRMFYRWLYNVLKIIEVVSAQSRTDFRLTEWITWITTELESNSTSRFAQKLWFVFQHLLTVYLLCLCVTISGSHNLIETLLVYVEGKLLWQTCTILYSVLSSGTYCTVQTRPCIATWMLPLAASYSDNCWVGVRPLVNLQPRDNKICQNMFFTFHCLF